MSVIYLTQGYETIVDDDLYKELNSYLWYASGNEGRPARRLRLGPRKMIMMYHQILHVLPWVLYKYNFHVDHINRNPLDNRKCNLRLAEAKVNARNTDRHLNRIGVSIDRTHNVFKAYIDQPDQARINIGTYPTENEAFAALAKAKLEYGICV